MEGSSTSASLPGTRNWFPGMGQLAIRRSARATTVFFVIPAPQAHFWPLLTSNELTDYKKSLMRFANFRIRRGAVVSIPTKASHKFH